MFFGKFDNEKQSFLKRLRVHFHPLKYSVNTFGRYCQFFLKNRFNSFMSLSPLKSSGKLLIRFQHEVRGYNNKKTDLWSFLSHATVISDLLVLHYEIFKQKCVVFVIICFTGTLFTW